MPKLTDGLVRHPDDVEVHDRVLVRAGDHLQARVEVLEAQPPDTAPRPRISMLTQTSPTGETSAEMEDLHQQLEVLREQLESAFDDVDTRIAAADQRAAATDTRAQIASARAPTSSTGR